MQDVLGRHLLKSIFTYCLLYFSLLSLPIEAIPLQNVSADAGIINEKQIQYWLMKRGVLTNEATPIQKHSAVIEFVGALAHGSNKALIELQAEKSRYAKRHAMKVNNTNTFSDIEHNVETSVNVLGVLVDFPNQLHGDNGLSSDDTPMYYEDYNREHYQNLLFSTSGYLGPNNQNLISGYQYFQAVSGQSFFFTGEVKDWITLSRDATYYGANKATKKDKAVSELVKEAVSQVVLTMSYEELSQFDLKDPYDLDSDGVIAEPDGMLDHIMIFHSSIGEEAGGGRLGTDAIWSHRGYVDAFTSGFHLPGTNKKIFGYTIQPIDATLESAMHQFAHDLGLPDEYDMVYQDQRLSAKTLSLMSSGYLTGKLTGSTPSGLSPYARLYLQDRYLGNWIQEQVDEPNNTEDDDEQLNQITTPILAEILDFSEPFEGEYQYYSKQGNLLNNAMSFDIELPSVRPLTLSMKAHWEIEADYDYSQVLVDGVAIAGNVTKPSNSVNNARNILTGRSADIANMSTENTWVDLTYDLSGYAGRNVRITVNYVTDEAEGGDGIVIDNIAVSQGEYEIYLDGAELDGQMSLVGFERVSNQISSKNRHRIILLPSDRDVIQ